MRCIFFAAALIISDTLRHIVRRRINSAAAKAVYGSGRDLCGRRAVMLSRTYSYLASLSAAFECKIEQNMKKDGRDNIQ